MARPLRIQFPGAMYHIISRGNGSVPKCSDTGFYMEGYTALYRRMTRMFDELNIAKADGRYPKLMMTWAKTNLIILDDLGMVPMNSGQRHDLLELMEDRYGQKSTIVTSQLPVEAWHEAIGDPTIADAILDRIIHNAHKINLKGESMRKRSNPLHQTDHLR